MDPFPRGFDRGDLSSPQAVEEPAGSRGPRQWGAATVTGTHLGGERWVALVDLAQAIQHLG